MLGDQDGAVGNVNLVGQLGESVAQPEHQPDRVRPGRLERLVGRAKLALERPDDVLQVRLGRVVQESDQAVLR